jgi:hypothetical protein
VSETIVLIPPRRDPTAARALAEIERETLHAHAELAVKLQRPDVMLSRLPGRVVRVQFRG